MNAPLILIVATLVFTLIIVLFRKQPVLSAAVAVLGAGLMAIFTSIVPMDEPLVFLGIPYKIASTLWVLGRALILDEGNRAAIGFLYFAGALLFCVAWTLRSSRNLYYVGLLSIGSVAASLMIQPFLFAAIFLEFAAMGAVLILVSPEYPARRGGIRLLVMFTVAMMAILTAGWMLENVGVTRATPELAHRATLLLALGFAAIMAVPPFHLWLPSAAAEANPYALAFVTVFLQSAGLFFLLRFLGTYEWLRDDPRLFSGIRMVGTAMVWFGSLMALSQRSFSKVMAYALLTDFGVMLLAVGAGTTESNYLALGLTGVRVVSVTVWASGMARIYELQVEDNVEALRGAAYRSPLAATAMLVGLMSIAGLPLTAGFPGRWGLLLALAPIDPFAGWAIVIAFFSIGVTTLRWADILLSEPHIRAQGSRSIRVRLTLGGGVALSLLVGAFPQIIYPWVVEGVSGVAQLLP